MNSLRKRVLERLMGLQDLFVTLQAVGTLLFAVLLWQLTRVISAPFLSYWSRAGVTLTIGLVFLRLSTEYISGTWPKHLYYSAYIFCLFHSLFLTWLGLRQFVYRTLASRCEYFLFEIPNVVLSAALPFGVSSFSGLLSVISPMIALGLLASLYTTRGYKTPLGHHPVGMPVVQFGLIGLILLFGHYWPVLIFCSYTETNLPNYLSMTAVLDSFAQLILAFGLVMLVAERVRDELAAKNEQLAEATRQLSEAARTDCLTGLLNRRAFDDLAREQHDKPFSGVIAVIDLNDLKLINDRFYHTAGDAALKIVARAMRNKFRVTDPLFRVGGDEFVAILSSGTIEDMNRRMIGLDQDLRTQRIPGIPETIHVAVSWGVMMFDKNVDLSIAYHQADQEMYLQKVQRKSLQSPQLV